MGRTRNTKVDKPKNWNDPCERCYDPLEAAEHLGLGVGTIYRLANSGEIPARKVGARWRFRKDVLDRWLGMKHK